MSLRSMFDVPPADSTHTLVLQLLADQQTMMNQLTELRSCVDYSVRLLEWFADCQERHNTMWLFAEANAERMTGAVIH